MFIVFLGVQCYRTLCENEVMSVGVTVEPHSCICPSQSYTCRADSILGMTWNSSMLTETVVYSTVTPSEKIIDRDGVLVQFSDVRVGQRAANFTSHLFITDIHTVNGSTFTCEASSLQSDGSDMITICVTGPASPPTNLSVVYDSSSTVVSFQPPVYGTQCVDYYVITAVSEERNVTCNATSEQLTYNCSIPQGSNVNEYNFTAYSITRGIDGVTYEGGIAKNCYVPLPENVRAVEVECGLQHLVNVSWQNSHLASVTTNIIVHSSEDLHYDDITNSEESYLLTLNYSVTGLLEISVTFSSHVHICSKTTVTQYYARAVLTGVSVSGTTLIIQSRDCIGSPENYRIVATFTDTSTELVNISFNSTIEHDVGDDVMPATQYSITIVLVETTSNTVIDERTTSFTTPSEPEPGDSVTYIAVGAGVGGAILVVIAGIVVVAVFVRNNRSKQDPVPSASGEEHGIKSQASIEDRRYAESDPPPDVVPHSVYADLNTVQREEKTKESVAPVYHVLEGPTPVETTASKMKEAMQDCSKTHDV